MNTEVVHRFAQERLRPEPTTMTLEEFLESDLEGYEYVKGELVPMPPTSLEHSDISVNLIFLLGSTARRYISVTMVTAIASRRLRSTSKAR